MMKIQILGTGCSKCKSLMANVSVALQELGLQAELEKIEDIEQIKGFGVTTTPALVVDGKVVVAGRLATVQQIKGLLGRPQASTCQSPGPTAALRTTVLLALMLCVGLVIYAKSLAKNSPASPTPTQTSLAVVEEKALPSMIEVGSENCIPCKAMQPVLKELRKDYAGKLRVDFVDLYKEEAKAEKYAVKMIPTQIFLDAQGKEIFRHTGFYGKPEIDAKLKELKVLR